MKIKNSFGVKINDLEKIYGSKNENIKEKIGNKLKTLFFQDNKEEEILKVLDEMIFGKKISNQEIEALILENILDFSDLGKKFEIREIDFGTNILIEGLFKKFKNDNNFFKIIPNSELETLKKSFENIESEYLRAYENFKNDKNGDVSYMLGSPINTEKVNIFLENLDFCIKNNLEMIAFTEEGFNSGEHKVATGFLKNFAIMLILFFSFTSIFTEIIDFGINSMLSERAKLENNIYFKSCKNQYKNNETNEKIYEKLYGCKKYEEFYEKDLTNLDKKLFAFKEGKIEYEGIPTSYSLAISFILSGFLTRFVLIFLEKRRRKKAEK